MPKRTQQIARKKIDEDDKSENKNEKDKVAETNVVKVDEASVRVIEMVSHNEGLFNRKTLFFHSNMGDMMFTCGYVSLFAFLVWDFLNNTQASYTPPGKQ